jgi:hypothetical protein
MHSTRASHMGLMWIMKGAEMKHGIRWLRRNARTKVLVLKIDRPRAIDHVIDYFGERLAPVMAADRAYRKS